MTPMADIIYYEDHLHSTVGVCCGWDTHEHRAIVSHSLIGLSIFKLFASACVCLSTVSTHCTQNENFHFHNAMVNRINCKVQTEYEQSKQKIKTFRYYF